MGQIDSSTQCVLDKLENICKDRFSGYVFVVVDGDNCYTTYSSKLLALGASEYLRRVVNDDLDIEDEIEDV